jgi:hypothetical protein
MDKVVRMADNQRVSISIPRDLHESLIEYKDVIAEEAGWTFSKPKLTQVIEHLLRKDVARIANKTAEPGPQAAAR